MSSTEHAEPPPDPAPPPRRRDHETPAASHHGQQQLIDQLVPLAAELVGTVRDYGLDDVAQVLARVPDGRHDALCVVLAAMVDPDTNTAQLLAWTDNGPVPSQEFEPAHMRVKIAGRGTTTRATEHREHVARMTRNGLTADQIADRLGITVRAVRRHRSPVRKAA